MFPHAFVDFPGGCQLREDTKTKEIEDLKAELRVKSLGAKGVVFFFPRKLEIQQMVHLRSGNASCLGVTWPKKNHKSEMDGN